MEQVELFPVVLQKTDTCWTYCLKRIGWKMWFGDVEGITIGFGKDVGYKRISIPKNESVSADHERIEEHFELLPISYTPPYENEEEPGKSFPFYPSRKDSSGVILEETYIQRGDLLLFTEKEKQHMIADRIKADGTVEYTSQIIRRHVAVCEGEQDGELMVSDAAFDYTSNSIEGLTAMSIRFRPLSSFKTQPTHVLRLKTH